MDLPLTLRVRTGMKKCCVQASTARLGWKAGSIQTNVNSSQSLARYENATGQNSLDDMDLPSSSSNREDKAIRDTMADDGIRDAAMASHHIGKRKAGDKGFSPATM